MAGEYDVTVREKLFASEVKNDWGCDKRDNYTQQKTKKLTLMQSKLSDDWRTFSLHLACVNYSVNCITILFAINNYSLDWKQLSTWYPTQNHHSLALRWPHIDPIRWHWRSLRINPILDFCRRFPLIMSQPWELAKKFTIAGFPTSYR